MSEEERTPKENGSQFAIIVRKAANLSADQWADDRIDALVRTVAPSGATAPEVAMFLAVASRYDLDPFLGEIWLAKDKGKLMVLTGRDSFLKVARREDRYSGYREGAVYEKDEFSMQSTEDGISIDHRISGFDRGKLVGAYCVVYMKDRPPVPILRKFSDYSHLHSKNNWRQNGEDMLLARCITSAHRLAFNISGLYTPDEAGDFTHDGKSGSDSTVAARQTKARIEELKTRMSATEEEEEVKEADFEVVQNEEEETLGSFQVNVASCLVEFGQYKGQTWGEVVTNPKGFGYIKHWILQKGYEHPSLTEEVKKQLQEMVEGAEAEKEAERGQEGPQNDVEAQEGVEVPPETPQPSKDPLEALDEAWTQGQEAAALLAKTDDLAVEDVDLLDDLREKEDLEGLQALVEKLKAQLAENVEKGVDPQLGF